MPSAKLRRIRKQRCAKRQRSNADFSVLGSALASFTCEKFGTDRLLELTQAELDERIQRFVDLVEFDIILKD